MSAYLVRRAAVSVVIALGLSMAIFGMLHVLYPSPAIVVLPPRTPNAVIAAWNREHGFDDPVIVQYLRYLNLALHGNLGFSYRLNQSVISLFQQRWARSAYLSGTSLLLALLIALPLVSSRQRGATPSGTTSRRRWRSPPMRFPTSSSP